MTSIVQLKPISATKGDLKSARLDRQASCEYLPMDVYVDPGILKAHFRGLTMHHRLPGAESTAGHVC